MARKTSISSLEIVSELAAQLRSTLSKLKRRLRDHGGREDLTPSQISVLLRLEKYGPGTASSLARAEGVRPQSMSSIIAALQNAGLVSGSPDPGDGRQTVISLTPLCREKIDTGRAARQDWLIRSIGAKLSPAEQEQLISALSLLERLADD
ncbi:MAG: MarR family transcriptional regulator [Cyanobacteria bacterium REEB67]|nr:MarR family transcriptional regulator [Cyanobacteria bacterium REEB67]